MPPFATPIQFSYDCLNGTSTLSFSIAGLYLSSVLLVPAAFPPLSPCPPTA